MVRMRVSCSTRASLLARWRLLHHLFAGGVPGGHGRFVQQGAQVLQVKQGSAVGLVEQAGQPLVIVVPSVGVHRLAAQAAVQVGGHHQRRFAVRQQGAAGDAVHLLGMRFPVPPTGCGGDQAAIGLVVRPDRADFNGVAARTEAGRLNVHDARGGRGQEGGHGFIVAPFGPWRVGLRAAAGR